MNRIYRRLHSADLPALLGMNGDFRAGFANEEAACAFLANPANFFFACLQDGRIIGFCFGYILQRLNDIGPMLYIHEVGVLESFQRQGIARNMLRGIKRLCKLSGYCRFFLFTQSSNVPACALYEGQGGEHGNADDVTYFFNDLDTGD